MSIAAQVDPAYNGQSFNEVPDKDIIVRMRNAKGFPYMKALVDGLSPLLLDMVAGKAQCSNIAKWLERHQGTHGTLRCYQP